MPLIISWQQNTCHGTCIGVHGVHGLQGEAHTAMPQIAAQLLQSPALLSHARQHLPASAVVLRGGAARHSSGYQCSYSTVFKHLTKVFVEDRTLRHPQALPYPSTSLCAHMQIGAGLLRTHLCMDILIFQNYGINSAYF